MAIRATVNQVVQIGAEVTPGTSVAASKLLQAFTWTFGEKVATKQFRGTGRQHPSASAVITEYAAGKISGPGDFAQLVYPFSSLWGSGAPALHSGATTAYDWVWTPALTGSYASGAKTFTVQNGDSNDAEQYAYLIFTGAGYSFTRKQEVQITGDWMAQTFTDGITLTASPTEVNQEPMTGAQFSVYLDSTSANIGNTQLTNVLKVDYAASNYYAPYFPVNRANASFTSPVDLEKKHELKLSLEAGTVGIAVRGNYLQIGTRCYVRVSGQGQLIENDQTVGVGAASGGTFTLTYKGQTTSALAYNASAGTIQTALRGLSTIGATGCSVSGAGPTWTVLFTGALAQDTTAMTGNGAGLTGGTFAITAAPVYAVMTHDMACFVADMGELTDVDGVYGVEYTLVVAEDTGWNSGQAQKMSLTNLVSAL